MSQISSKLREGLVRNLTLRDILWIGNSEQDGRNIIELCGFLKAGV